MRRRKVEINRDKLIQLLIHQHKNLGIEQLPEHTDIHGITLSRNLGLALERQQVIGVYTIRYHNMLLTATTRTIGYESLLTNLNASSLDEFLIIGAEFNTIVMLIFTDGDITTLFGILRAAAQV